LLSRCAITVRIQRLCSFPLPLPPKLDFHLQKISLMKRLNFADAKSPEVFFFFFFSPSILQGSEHETVKLSGLRVTVSAMDQHLHGLFDTKFPHDDHGNLNFLNHFPSLTVTLLKNVCVCFYERERESVCVCAYILVNNAYM
jgi:hypothetical protein